MFVLEHCERRIWLLTSIIWTEYGGDSAKQGIQGERY